MLEGGGEEREEEEGEEGEGVVTGGKEGGEILRRVGL